MWASPEALQSTIVTFGGVEGRPEIAVFQSEKVFLQPRLPSEIMSCILRVSGEALDIDALMSGLTLSADQTWRKGQLRSKVSGRPHANSGVNFVASDADLDAFAQQVTDATAFLESNSATISKVASFPGVEQVTLDFGVALSGGNVAMFSYLPPPLVRLAAQANIGIEISHYLCSEERGAEG
jgi:hypothetical protein